jgi:alkanesulfonate monooxygenase SsuD/methylene tetrahydromethanopterin reductase-like flavin-dependent oxidoreductase (luciferase family)
VAKVQIGIGLPNTIDIAGGDMASWAVRAEERGFSHVGTIDRFAYPSYDSLLSLAVAAGATTRIGLLTDILLAPAYPPVWLAKATAGLAAMSGERLTLGLAVGGRADDYAAVERSFERRGAEFDGTLDLLRRSWAGEPVIAGELPVGPPVPSGRVPVLIGGNVDAAIRRTVEYGAGWTAGGGGPAMAAPMVEKVIKAWADAGRTGEPRIGALVYYGLGSEEVSRASLRRYYAFLGEWVEAIVEGADRTPEALRATVSAYGDIGVGEVTFFPTVGSLDQVDRLADAVL